MRRWAKRRATTLALACAVAAVLLPGPAHGGNTIRLVINGVLQKPDVPPVVVEGRTMVPLRFIGQALGCTVTWDEASRTVYVITAPAQGSEAAAGTGEEEKGVHIVSVDLKAECVTLRNDSTSSDRVDIGGWKIVSVVGGESFTFPTGFSLGPAQTVRVWSGPGAIPASPADLRWSTDLVWTDTGDPARLFDADGRLVDEYP